MSSKTSPGKRERRNSSGEPSNEADSHPTSEPKSDGKNRGGKRTHWWFVLAGIALIVVLTGLFAPGAIRNYCVYQAEKQLKLRDYDTALEWLDSAGQISPNDGEVSFLKARSYRKKGEFADYEKSMQEARRLDYSRDRCRREEWLKQAQSGKMSEVETHLKELLDDEFGDSAEVAEAFANGYLLTGRLSEAKMFLDRWEDDFPEDPQPKLMSGLVFRQYGQRDKAIDLFREALNLQPGYYPAMLALADTLQVEREFDEAISLYEQVSESPTYKLEALSKLGFCLRRNGDLERAKEVLEQAREIDEDHINTLVELGRVKVFMQEYDAAIEHLEVVLGTDEANGDVHGLYATALRGVGRVDEAAEHAAYSEEATRMLGKAGDLSRQLKDDDEDLSTRVRVGRIILKYGKEQEGLVWLFSTLDIDPQYALAHAALSEHYQRKAVKDARYDQAAQMHRQLAGNVTLGPLE